MGPFFNIEKAAIDARLASAFRHNSLRENLHKYLSIFPIKIGELYSSMVKSSPIPLVQEILMAFEKGKFKRRVIR